MEVRMVLSNDKNHKEADRRCETRFEMDVPVRTDEGDGTEEKLLDMSARGCRLITPLVYNEGDMLLVDLTRNRTTILMHSPEFRRGKVVWVRRGTGNLGEYGIEFFQ